MVDAAPQNDAIDPLELAHKQPHLSAVRPVTLLQKLFLVLACIAIIAASYLAPWTTARLFIFLATLFYLVYSLYKLYVVWHSVQADAEIHVEADELAGLADEELPIYSILVPMYQEPETLPHLVQALNEMDYPADRKDVQLLLEEDDDATLAAARAIDLPPGFRVTEIPESFPRTKPKACNIGLAHARGKYLVIYDAEDRPERDQLKKAVAAFKRVPETVVCLQSRLNFYNPRQNLLTRWFAAEYSAWFDLSLPGLSALDAVIPLGGTSNHFVTRVLRDMMGWDAYNVTEDCDLGVRIYREGGRSRMLHTTTWEEACSSLPFWIKQRTRWLKGYIQTYLVHMRRPFRLLADLGLRNFTHYQLIVGASILAFLMNPLFWILALIWFVLRLDVLTELFPLPVFVLGALCLFVGNFVFVYLNAIGCYRRQRFDLVKYALLSPLYWVLMSISAWRAFIQFFADPFYWEKTQHGLSEGQEG